MMRLDEELKIRNVERPVVFLADGHSSHISIDLFLWCRDHQIIFVILPPNTTHLLQMCDTSIFGPTKSRWRKGVSELKRQEQKTELNHKDFIKILANVMKITMTPDAIKNGFRGTGIFPLNRQAVHDDRIIGTLPAYVNIDPPRNSADNITANSLLETTPYVAAAEQANDLSFVEENAFEYLIFEPILDQPSSSSPSSSSSPCSSSKPHSASTPAIPALRFQSDNVLNALCDKDDDETAAWAQLEICREANQNFMAFAKRNNSQYLFNSQIIEQQLNMMTEKVIIHLPQGSEPSNKEPLLTPPSVFARKGTARSKKRMCGAVTANEAIESRLEEIREKEKVQKEKDERKLIREQNKIIKANAVKIKLEQDEKRQEAEAAGEIVPKKRGRKPKLDKDEKRQVEEGAGMIPLTKRGRKPIPRK
jgi:hypothetical protein